MTDNTRVTTGGPTLSGQAYDSESSLSGDLSPLPTPAEVVLLPGAFLFESPEVKAGMWREPTFGRLSFAERVEQVPAEFRILFEGMPEGAEFTSEAIYFYYLAYLDTDGVTTEPLQIDILKTKIKQTQNYLTTLADRYQIECDARLVMNVVLTCLVNEDLPAVKIVHRELDNLVFDAICSQAQEAAMQYEIELRLVEQQLKRIQSSLIDVSAQIATLVNTNLGYMDHEDRDEFDGVFAEVNQLELRRNALLEQATHFKEEQKKLQAQRNQANQRLALNEYKLLLNLGSSQETLDRFLLALASNPDAIPEELKEKVKSAQLGRYAQSHANDLSVLTVTHPQRALEVAVTQYNEMQPNEWIVVLDAEYRKASAEKAEGIEREWPEWMKEIPEGYEPIQLQGDGSRSSDWLYVKRLDDGYHVRLVPMNAESGVENHNSRRLGALPLQDQTLTDAQINQVQQQQMQSNQVVRAVMANNVELREFLRLGEELQFEVSVLAQMVERGVVGYSKDDEFLELLQQQAQRVMLVFEESREGLVQGLDMAQFVMQQMERMVGRNANEAFLRDMQMLRQQLSQIEMSMDKIPEFCESVLQTQESYDADRALYFIKTDLLILSTAVLGGVLCMTGVGALLGSGAFAGASGLLLSAGLSGLGGVGGEEFGRHISGHWFDTGMMSNWERYSRGELSQEELAETYLTSWAYQSTMTLAFLGMGRLTGVGGRWMAASKNQMVSQAGMEVLNAGSIVQRGVERLLAFNPNSLVGRIAAKAGQEYLGEMIEEGLENTAQQIHPALGSMMTVMNCLDGRNLDVALYRQGVVIESQQWGGKGIVQITATYDTGKQIELMERLRELYPNAKIELGQVAYDISVVLDRRDAGEQEVRIKFNPSLESYWLRKGGVYLNHINGKEHISSFEGCLEKRLRLTRMSEVNSYRLKKNSSVKEIRDSFKLLGMPLIASEQAAEDPYLVFFTGDRLIRIYTNDVEAVAQPNGVVSMKGSKVTPSQIRYLQSQGITNFNGVILDIIDAGERIDLTNCDLRGVRLGKAPVSSELELNISGSLIDPQFFDDLASNNLFKIQYRNTDLREMDLSRLSGSSGILDLDLRGSLLPQDPRHLPSFENADVYKNHRICVDQAQYQFLIEIGYTALGYLVLPDGVLPAQIPSMFPLQLSGYLLSGLQIKMLRQIGRTDFRGVTCVSFDQAYDLDLSHCDLRGMQFGSSRAFLCTKSINIIDSKIDAIFIRSLLRKGELHFKISQEQFDLLLQSGCKNFSSFNLEELDLSSYDLSSLSIDYSTTLPHESKMPATFEGFHFKSFSGAFILEAILMREGLDLSGAFFDNVLSAFSMSDLSKVNFENASFRECDLSGTNFNEANMNGVTMDETTLLTLPPDFDFTNHSMIYTDLTGAGIARIQSLISGSHSVIQNTTVTLDDSWLKTKDITFKNCTILFSDRLISKMKDSGLTFENCSFEVSQLSSLFSEAHHTVYFSELGSNGLEQIAEIMRLKQKRFQHQEAIDLDPSDAQHNSEYSFIENSDLVLVLAPDVVQQYLTAGYPPHFVGVKFSGDFTNVSWPKNVKFEDCEFDGTILPVMMREKFEDELTFVHALFLESAQDTPEFFKKYFLHARDFAASRLGQANPKFIFTEVQALLDEDRYLLEVLEDGDWAGYAYLHNIDIEVHSIDELRQIEELVAQGRLVNCRIIKKIKPPVEVSSVVNLNSGAALYIDLGISDTVTERVESVLDEQGGASAIPGRRLVINAYSHGVGNLILTAEQIARLTEMAEDENLQIDVKYLDIDGVAQVAEFRGDADRVRDANAAPMLMAESHRTLAGQTLSFEEVMSLKDQGVRDFRGVIILNEKSFQRFADNIDLSDCDLRGARLQNQSELNNFSKIIYLDLSSAIIDQQFYDDSLVMGEQIVFHNVDLRSINLSSLFDSDSQRLHVSFETAKLPTQIESYEYHDTLKFQGTITVDLDQANMLMEIGFKKFGCLQILESESFDHTVYPLDLSGYQLSVAQIEDLMQIGRKNFRNAIILIRDSKNNSVDFTGCDLRGMRFVDVLNMSLDFSEALLDSDFFDNFPLDTRPNIITISQSQFEVLVQKGYTDFRFFDLSAIDLSKTDMSKFIFDHTKFPKNNMLPSSFSGYVFTRQTNMTLFYELTRSMKKCDFSGSTIDSLYFYPLIDLNEINFSNAKFINCLLAPYKFDTSELHYEQFHPSQFHGAQFDNTTTINLPANFEFEKHAIVYFGLDERGLSKIRDHISGTESVIENTTVVFDESWLKITGITFKNCNIQLLDNMRSKLQGSGLVFENCNFELEHVAELFTLAHHTLYFNAKQGGNTQPNYLSQIAEIMRLKQERFQLLEAVKAEVENKGHEYDSEFDLIEDSDLELVLGPDAVQQYLTAGYPPNFIGVTFSGDFTNTSWPENVQFDRCAFVRAIAPSFTQQLSADELTFSHTIFFNLDNKFPEFYIKYYLYVNDFTPTRLGQSNPRFTFSEAQALLNEDQYLVESLFDGDWSGHAYLHNIDIEVRSINELRQIEELIAQGRLVNCSIIEKINQQNNQANPS